MTIVDGNIVFDREADDA